MSMMTDEDEYRMHLEQLQTARIENAALKAEQDRLLAVLDKANEEIADLRAHHHGAELAFVRLAEVGQERDRLANDYAQAVEKFDACRAALARTFALIGGNPTDVPDAVEWHEWLITSVDTAIVELRAERDRLQADIRRWIQDIMERREYARCWHVPQPDDGDCGNWLICYPHCSLREMMDLVGIVPQEDGGLDKQQVLTEPLAEQAIDQMSREQVNAELDRLGLTAGVERVKRTVKLMLENRRLQERVMVLEAAIRNCLNWAGQHYLDWGERAETAWSFLQAVLGDSEAQKTVDEILQRHPELAAPPQGPGQEG